MTRAVIDIGSNSVRLMIEGVKDKEINTTQLAEGLAVSGLLKPEAMERTAEAVAEFYIKAKASGADPVYAFATEAVRSALNGSEFIDMMYTRHKISVDLLSPEREARAGYLGASDGSRCAVVDIGGASTEIVTGAGGELDYIKSVPVGIVRLKDLCGQDRDKLNAYIAEKIKEFGAIPKVGKAYAIGGSASSVAAMIMGGYDRDRVHHYIVGMAELNKALEILDSASDKSKILGLQPKRAMVIAGGIILLKQIMGLLGVSGYVVSEEDNMEGYLKTI